MSRDTDFFFFLDENPLEIVYTFNKIEFRDCHSHLVNLCNETLRQMKSFGFSHLSEKPFNGILIPF